jgi:hypothetical protein
MSTTLAIPLLPANSAPGNYLFEQDTTQFATAPATTIGGMAIALQQGPMWKEYTSPAQFVSACGTPNPDWSLGPYSALTFLNASSQLTVRRVVNTDAEVAASYLFLTSGTAISAILGLYPEYTPYEDLDYTGAVPNFSIVNVLPNFNTNGPTTVVAVLFDVNNEPTTVDVQLGATLAAFVANLNEGLNPDDISAVLGTWYNYTEQETQACIYFIGPTNKEFNLVSLTLGSTVITPNTDTDNQYNMDCLAIQALSYGDYANNALGWTITNVNMGTPQQVVLTFSRQLIVGDSIEFEANVYTTGLSVNTSSYNLKATATYATSNDATLEALASAIQDALDDVCTASVVVPDSTGNNAREIIIVMEAANLNGNYYAIANTMTVNGNGPLDYATATTVITDGSGAPSELTVSITQSVLGVASNNTFNFNVYSSSNTNVPIETFTGSLNNTTTANGATTNIVSLMNNDSTGSLYLRLVNLLPSGVQVFPNLWDNITKIQWLNGGEDGSLPTNVQIAAAWNDFSDTDNVDVDMLINGGYTTPTVQQAMDAVCQTREDMCFAYLDLPSNVQSSTDNGVGAISYRQNSLNLNSNRSGLFGPDVYINDPYTGAPIYVPMSGYAAADQAIADTNVGPQQAAAGPTYGALNNILGLRVVYNKTARGNLNAAQVNIAKKLRAGGYAIYGAVTLQTTASLLSYIPVRRIFSFIEQLVLDLLEGVDFNNITPTLELNVQQNVNAILQTYINNGAILNAKCVTDSTVNTQQYANNGQFNVRVIIYPFSPAQFVVLDGVLTNSTAVFTETTVSA